MTVVNQSTTIKGITDTTNYIPVSTDPRLMNGSETSILMDATQGTLWAFKYRSTYSGTPAYKWNFMGGSPFYVEQTPGSALALSDTGGEGVFAGLTPATTLVMPGIFAEGEFLVTVGMDIEVRTPVTGGGGAGVATRVFLGTGSAFNPISERTSAHYGFHRTEYNIQPWYGYDLATVERTTKMRIGGSETLTLQYCAVLPAGTEAFLSAWWMSILPVRVRQS